MAGLRARLRTGRPITALTIAMLVLCLPRATLSCVDRTSDKVMSALVLASVIDLVLPQLMKIIELDGIHDINESTLISTGLLNLCCSTLRWWINCHKHRRVLAVVSAS